MMRHTSLVFGGGFGSADIHPPVDSECVDGHDMGTRGLGSSHGDFGFPRPSWANQGDQLGWRIARHHRDLVDEGGHVTDQVMVGGSGDLNLVEGARFYSGAGWQVDQTVVAGTPTHHGAVGLGGAFD